MMRTFHLLVFWPAAVALVYTCFCRLAKTSKKNTIREVRWTFTALGLVAIACACAPLFGYEPDGIAAGLMGVIALTQIVTSRHWRAGIPKPFLKE